MSSVSRAGRVLRTRHRGGGGGRGPCRTESLESRLLLATFTVTHGRDAGAGSLRQAILDANAAAGADTVRFAITTGSEVVKTIGLLSPLPAVTGPTVIDGTTQTGWAAGRPVIQLTGLFAGTDDVGLEMSGGNSTVRGLIVNLFDRIGIWMRAGDNNVIEGNWIGLNADGTAAQGNLNGISISGADDTRVGGTTLAARNVISGNRGSGVFTNAARTVIAGNYIGTNAAGTAAVGNLVGVDLSGTAGAVGSTAAAGRNVISGNTRDGVRMHEPLAGRAEVTGNAVLGNFIGTNAAGTAVLGYGQHGVWVGAGARNNVVGGTTVGAGNVIAGPGQAVRISRTFDVETVDNPVGPTQNRVEGNFLGVNAAGSRLGSGNNVGVRIDDAADNTVGGTAAGARNILSGNIAGVSIRGAAATGNRVQGNYIGLSTDGVAAVPNNVGVDISGAPGNFIGGTAAGAGNVISGNRDAGVSVAGVDATNNRVEGNFIGTTRTGSAARANGKGVLIVLADGTIVGGSVAGARNVISGNTSDGVYVQDASRCEIKGNLIGPDAAGRAALGNGGHGVIVLTTPTGTATGNLVGAPTADGPGTGPGNLISGNHLNGVTIQGNARNNRVSGNVIGLDATGNVALGAGNLYGVWITADAVDNVVGEPSDIIIEPIELAGVGADVGVAPAGGVLPQGLMGNSTNVISGNDIGVLVNGASNTVSRNYIGTNVAGTAAVGNRLRGVEVNAGAGRDAAGPANQVSNNVVSGNQTGILVAGAAVGTRVTENYVGTSADGNAALPNTLDGVVLQGGATRTTVGVVSASGRPGNVISGNGRDGVRVSDANMNFVVGNFIGTALDGRAALGNAGNGVSIEGTSANNVVYFGVIANNGGAGVRVTGGSGNQVAAAARVSPTPTIPLPQGLSIHSNGGLGIDLGAAGVTPNDAGDADAGANTLQNVPVLDAATNGRDGVVVSGTLNSVPGRAYRVEFFASPAADPSGFGEGQHFVGFADVTTDAAGNAAFTATLPGAAPGGYVVTATATAADGSTSEFSAPVAVPPGTGGPRVRQVAVGDDAWALAFRNFLRGPDITAFTGYSVPAGAAQLNALPWSGVGVIAIGFNEPVTVAQDDLSVRGVARATYGISRFLLSADRKLALWLLSDVAANDKLLLDLDADTGGVTGSAGLALDGEWANGADAWPSGDGRPGGDFRFRLNLLTGDADGNGRVNALDLADVRRRLGRSTTSLGTGGGAYSATADITADARINALDLAAVRRMLGRRLPDGEPADVLAT